MEFDSNQVEITPIENDRPQRGLFRNPLFVNALVFIAGVVIGLVVLGWGPFALEWTDAAIVHLRQDLQEDYMRTIIDSYKLNVDDELAKKRLTEFGATAPSVLAVIAENPGDQSTEVISLLKSIVDTIEFEDVDNLGTDRLGQPGLDPEGVPDEGGGFFDTRTILLGMCALTFILAGSLAVLYFLRNRRKGVPDTPAIRAQEISQQAPQTDYQSMGTATPISQWVTTYLLGDDLFDDSFSIDAPGGEFMGECGLGIADTIGVGEPKRVSAFEIWLFDKNDIQTITKVLMSDHAFNDDIIRDRLAAKGEPILAEPGQEVILETETLRMAAKVVEMDFGEGALPDHSFFERLTIELAVWSKS